MSKADKKELRCHNCRYFCKTHLSGKHAFTDKMKWCTWGNWFVYCKCLILCLCKVVESSSVIVSLTCQRSSLQLFFSHLKDIWVTKTKYSVVHVSTRLADYDVVVTTYSLVSKEIPVQKEEADKPNTDKDDVVNTTYTTGTKAFSVNTEDAGSSTKKENTVFVISY